MKNYYDILQVSKDADYDVIDRVHKFLIKKYHPDVSDNNSEIVSEINNAYEVLSNPKKRKEYDMYLLNIETSKSIEKINNINSNKQKNTNESDSYISYNINILKDLILKVFFIFVFCLITMLIILIATGYNTFEIFFR